MPYDRKKDFEEPLQRALQARKYSPREWKCEYCGTIQSGQRCGECGAPCYEPEQSDEIEIISPTFPVP